MEHRAENPAKVYLRRYRALVIRQESIRRAIEAAYDRATSITSRLRAVPVSGGGAGDRMAEDVARIMDETAQLEQLLDASAQALSEILRAIEVHTTGTAGMTKLDMVVFLADKVEPVEAEEAV